MVLQQVHQKLRESTEDRQVSPIFLKLTRTCEEAAMKCVVVLSRLKQNNMIGKLRVSKSKARFICSRKDSPIRILRLGRNVLRRVRLDHAKNRGWRITETAG